MFLLIAFHARPEKEVGGCKSYQLMMNHQINMPQLQNSAVYIPAAKTKEIAASHLSTMDSSNLQLHLQNTYIPNCPSKAKKDVPPYHPCLIVQDKQTDASKLKPCGCADAYCVKDAPSWIPRASR